jgi:hypothetical protein
MIDLASQATGDLGGASVLLLALIMGHMLGDFPLQGQFLALGKERGYWRGEHAPTNGGRCMWMYCLTAHSLIQAGIVWLISGSLVLCLVELVVHWVIDLSKGEGLINLATDQLLHIGTKVIFAAAIYLQLVS